MKKKIKINFNSILQHEYDIVTTTAVRILSVGLLCGRSWFDPLPYHTKETVLVTLR